MKQNFIYFILLFCMLGQSCIKDPHPSWETKMIAPLISSRLDFNNLINDTLLNIDQDSFVSIIYETTLYEFKVDSLVDFPDTISEVQFQLPVSGTINPGTQLINETEEEEYDFGNAELRFVRVKKGRIHFKVFNTIDEKMVLKYKISSASKNGFIFEIEELIPAGFPNTFIYEKDYDISGYDFNMTGINGGKANILITSTQIDVDPAGNPVYVTQSDGIQINITLEDFEIDYLKGYLGSEIIESGYKNNSFNFFQNINGGSLDLEQVLLSMDIINGFGIDLRMFVNDLISVNNKTGNSIPSDAAIIGNPININRAIETFNASDPVIPELKHFDLGNSNIIDLMENIPDQFGYSVDFITNPLGNVTGGNDFIYTGQQLRADLTLEIPLSLSTNNLILSDTSDFQFSLDEDVSHVTYGEFRLIADNGFPFIAHIQIYLYENNNLIDSLFSGITEVAAAPADQNFKVIGVQRSVISAVIDRDKMQQLDLANEMVVNVKLNTIGNGQHIKLYYDYFMDVQLTGDFGLVVKQ